MLLADANVANQHVAFLMALGALSKLVVLSFMIERALAFIFEHDWFVGMLGLISIEMPDPNDPTKIIRKTRIPGIKGTVALAVSIWLCFKFKFDVLSILFTDPSATAHPSAGTEQPVETIGVILTGLITAGGSSGAIAIMQSYLGLGKDTRDARIATMQVELEIARATAEKRFADTKVQNEITAKQYENNKAQIEIQKTQSEIENQTARSRAETRRITVETDIKLPADVEKIKAETQRFTADSDRARKNATTLPEQERKNAPLASNSSGEQRPPA